jgi:hypothetical protein
MSEKFSKLSWRKDAVPHTRDLTATQLRVLDVVFNHTNAEGKNAHHHRRPSPRWSGCPIGRFEGSSGTYRIVV